jgi:hypothetical protein
LYKTVLQLDNATEWVLTAITPTWVQVGGAGLAPAAHAASHENGGADEISVAGLSGVLADPQTPASHTHPSTDITDFDEAVEDKIGAKVIAGTGISVGYNDTTGETTITNTSSGGSGGFGDVVGPSSSVASEFALFDGTTGKLIKSATGSGFVKSTSGVYSTEANPVTGLPFELVVACSDLTTALTTGTTKNTFPWPRSVTLSSVHAFLVTPQTSGSTFTVDVNENGSTILSTKITIDNGEADSTTAATAPVLSDTGLAVMSVITVDIDQVGDGTAKGLYLVFVGVYA